MKQQKKKKAVQTENAAPLNVPLSPAIQYGNLLFVSGQVSTDVEKAKPIVGTIEEETELALRNLSDLLRSAGSSLKCVLKVTVFLREMKDYQKMNEVYSRYFPHDPPSRSTLGNVALAASYKVEIEAVAYIPEE